LIRQPSGTGRADDLDRAEEPQARLIGHGPPHRASPRSLRVVCAAGSGPVSRPFGQLATG
jgi:hypothetical protein